MTTGSDHVDAFSVGQGSGLCSLPIMSFSMRCVVDSFWQMLVWVRYHRYSPMMCDGESLLIALASRTLYPLCIGNGVRTTGWRLPNASQLGATTCSSLGQPRQCLISAIGGRCLSQLNRGSLGRTAGHGAFGARYQETKEINHENCGKGDLVPFCWRADD